MKYYYDCAIEAAYMAKNFRIPFSYQHKITSNFIETLESLETSDPENILSWLYYRYYVHTKGLPIFEPQVGDLITINDGESANLVIHPDMVKVIEANKNRFVAAVKIIQRNGKPFIMPKVETTAQMSPQQEKE